MTTSTGTPSVPPPAGWRAILLYGAVGGILIALLKLVEYRFLVVSHAVEVYGGLVAAIFAALGIWLGVTLTRKKPDVIVREVPVPVAGDFVLDESRLAELGITPETRPHRRRAQQPRDRRAVVRE